MTIGVAPDGSPVEVFATFPPGPAPAYLAARLGPASTVLDLGCGAGRLALPLAAAGHRVTGVDLSEAMIARFVVRIGADSAPILTTKPDGEGRGAAAGGLEGVVADIDGLDLGRRFDAVILASYLVNDPDRGRAGRFLQTCRRHVRPTGKVFVQRHHPAFLGEVDAEESTEDGYGYRFERTGRDGEVVRARMTYLHRGRSWTQEFAATVLDDDAVVAALTDAGLHFTGWLDELHTWAEATPT